MPFGSCLTVWAWNLYLTQQDLCRLIRSKSVFCVTLAADLTVYLLCSLLWGRDCVRADLLSQVAITVSQMEWLWRH